MSPRKLTEPDKQEILRLYRQTGATTSTLATQYGVSSSTISRFLKSNLSENEYEDLIQQKRLARTSNRQSDTSDSSTSSATANTKPVASDQTDEASQLAKPTVKKTRRRITKPTESEPAAAKKVIQIPDPQSSADEPEVKRVVTTSKSSTDNAVADSKSKPVLNSGVRSLRKTRKRLPDEAADQTDSVDEPITTEVEEAKPAASIELDSTDSELLTANTTESKSKPKPIINKIDREEETNDPIDMITLSEMLGEEIDEDDEDDEDDEIDWEETELDNYPQAKTGEYTSISIMPLATANLKQTCYIVVDRASELITRPLKDFADLGTIPKEEIQQKTLPVFDNHRVAKRFAHRRERVVKVPDGRMLQKVSNYLEAKGINRLLIDGQIYSLSV